MAIMMRDLYRALIAAGASEQDAGKASEEVAAHETRLSGFELKLTKMEGDIGLLKWMVGFNIALSIGIVVKLFVP